MVNILPKIPKGRNFDFGGVKCHNTSGGNGSYNKEVIEMFQFTIVIFKPRFPIKGAIILKEIGTERLNIHHFVDSADFFKIRESAIDTIHKEATTNNPDGGLFFTLQIICGEEEFNFDMGYPLTILESKEDLLKIKHREKGMFLPVSNPNEREGVGA